MTCGFVVTDKIADSRPEWRAFDDEQRAKRARTGAPMTFTIHDKGLSTIIDWRDRPSGTKSVSADQRIELYKLRKWQRRVRVSDATERNLAVALSELSKLLRELGMFVPPSANRSYAARFSNRLVISGKAEGIAIRILEIARQMKLTSGRGPAGIAAASTYIATVLTNERKTQREIAEIANVTEVTIRNRYKELLEKLMIEVPL